MTKSPVLLSIKNLDYTIRKKKILEDINMDIMRGDKIGIVGANGVGKTTLLKLISGSLFPTKGDIQINGISLKSLGIHLTDELPPYCLGKDYLYYCGILSNMDENLIESSIQQISEELEITYLDKKIKKYSQGMKKRLALAGTLIHSPSLVLFDEPTNFLDSRGKELFVKYLNKKKENTYVITSHDVNKLYKICNKVIKIDNGKIVESIHLKLSEKIYKVYVDRFIEGFNIQTEDNSYFKVISKKEIHQTLYNLIAQKVIVLDIQIIN